MEIEIIGLTTDSRTNTPVAYGQMKIADYLELVGDDFDKFAIQRRREKHRNYGRMKEDIIKGALLPPITLAVDPERANDLLPLFNKKDLSALAKAIVEIGQVSILDGLQRTYILKDLERAGEIFKENQKLLLEFWIEANIQNLIYRIIVLNAGQKPMSMRHQIEVLFSTFKNTLTKEIPDLELFEEKDGGRRTRPRKYAFDRVVTAYQSFLSKSPEIQKENLVAQRLMEEDVLSESEESLTEKFNNFKKYLGIYAQLDDEICRVYDGSQEAPAPNGLAWFGNDNVMNSFFAAIADFGSSDDRFARIDRALEALKDTLRNSEVGFDALGLGISQSIIAGTPSRKVNVGFATRKLLTAVFKEYFREEGEKALSEFWTTEAG